MTAQPAIASVQTPPGRGGIAVILLSGSRAGQIISQIFRPGRSHSKAEPGMLQLGHIVSGRDVIDEAIVAHRPGLAEINIHGGPAAARATLELLARAGAKIEPGPASSVENFQPAHPKWNNPAIGREMLEVLPGVHSVLVASAVSFQWSDGLCALASDPAVPAEDLRQAAAGLEIMNKLFKPPELVLAGPPNVGKSTLANAIVGRQVSITHAQAGTTRDWVRELALLAGLPVYLTDTAGIWDAPDHIDAEAIRRARNRLEKADLVLLLQCGEPAELPAWCHTPRALHISTKRDITAPLAGADAAVCAVTGEGLDELQQLIGRALGLDDFDPAVARAFTERQAKLLLSAAEANDQGDAPAAESALSELLTGKA